MYSGRARWARARAARRAQRGHGARAGSSGCSSRYFKVKVRDVGGTADHAAQAPIIGVLLALVFGGQKDAIPYWCLGALQELGKRSGGLGDGNSNDLLQQHAGRRSDNPAPIFFLVVAAVWFGTSNAAREIVSERAIYMRERMVNLRLFNYVFSKFILLSLFCVDPVHGAARHRVLRARLPRRAAGVRHRARDDDHHGDELGRARAARRARW